MLCKQRRQDKASEKAKQRKSYYGNWPNHPTYDQLRASKTTREIEKDVFFQIGKI